MLALGAGEIVLPVNGADGEKRIDVQEFGSKVQRVLKDQEYRASARAWLDRCRDMADRALEVNEEVGARAGGLCRRRPEACRCPWPG